MKRCFDVFRVAAERACRMLRELLMQLLCLLQLVSPDIACQHDADHGGWKRREQEKEQGEEIGE